MNSHTDIQKQLSAYCSGDLEAAEQARVEAHLAICPACRADLTDIRTTLQAVRTIPHVDPPLWLKSRIMAHLREEQALKQSWRFPQHTGFPVKALALLIVGISGYYLSHTVETELKQVDRQQLQESPVLQPQTKSAPPLQELSPPLKQERSATVQQPAAVPSASPAAPPQQRQKSPPIQSPGQVPAPPASATYAPSPPAEKDRYVDKAALKKEAPAAESNLRRPEFAAERKMKSSPKKADLSSETSSSTAAGRAAGAPAGMALPQQGIIRLNIADVSTAHSQIRDAILRSGGTIAEDPGISAHRLKAQLPGDRQNELLERLGRLGKITQRPAPTMPETSLVEMTIQW